MDIITASKWQNAYAHVTWNQALTNFRLFPQSDVAPRGTYFSKSQEQSIHYLTDGKVLTPSQHLIASILQSTRCSVRQLSKNIDIPHRTLYDIANGTSRRPKFSTFSKLLGYYCYVCIIGKNKKNYDK